MSWSQRETTEPSRQLGSLAGTATAEPSRLLGSFRTRPPRQRRPPRHRRKSELRPPRPFRPRREVRPAFRKATSGGLRLRCVGTFARSSVQKLIPFGNVGKEPLGASPPKLNHSVTSAGGPTKLSRSVTSEGAPVPEGDPWNAIPDPDPGTSSRTKLSRSVSTRLWPPALTSRAFARRRASKRVPCPQRKGPQRKVGAPLRPR